jgi:hypothetical protein
MNTGYHKGCHGNRNLNDDDHGKGESYCNISGNYYEGIKYPVNFLAFPKTKKDCLISETVFLLFFE